MSLQVVVPTCDKYVNLMPGFFHQWSKYCGLPGMVVCEQSTPKVPTGWSFFKAGFDTPSKGWAGNLIAALEQVHTETVLLVLDDYWLTEAADTKRIRQLANWMCQDHSIDKIDITNDRMGFPHAHYGQEFVRSLPLAPYLTSTQAAIWRTSFLRHCLSDPSWNPWQFEIIGSEHIKGAGHKILGCRVPCIRYANVMLKGKFNSLEINKLHWGDVYEFFVPGLNDKTYQLKGKQHE